MIPVPQKRYFEPFLGSGALFFALEPPISILSDVNNELIQTFAAIRDDWKRVVTLLRRYQKLHSERFYYQIRSSRPQSLCSIAARFVYLNRTCWNGLYRVNLRGEFNVPKGTKKAVLLEADDFERLSFLLRNARLLSSDFEAVMAKAGRGDVIFANPPYITGHVNNGFVKYNEKLFSWHDQIRLQKSLLGASKRGAVVISTNANSVAIRELYGADFRIHAVVRTTTIAANSARRGTSTELIITNR